MKKGLGLDDSDNPPPVKHQPSPPIKQQPPLPPPPSPVDVNTKKIESMNKILADYKQLKQSGGKLPFSQYLGNKVKVFLHEHPKAPPDEKGIESEGLGPIGWILWGWEMWSEGIVEGGIKAIGEKAVELIIDSYDSFHIERPDQSTPENTPENPDAGTPPPMGTGTFGGDENPTDGEAGGQGQVGEEGGGCFVKGTLVATPQGLIPIEQIQVMAEVYALDQTRNILVSQKVIDIIQVQRQEILVLNFGDEKIRCTPPHRFYIGQWVAAQKLQVGDRVLNRDGRWKAVHDIRREIQRQPVYNLTVAGIHNYLIGNSCLLVHNDKVSNPENPEDEKKPVPLGVKRKIQPTEE